MGFYLGAMNTDTYQSPHGSLYAALDAMPAVDVDIHTDALRDVGSLYRNMRVRPKNWKFQLTATAYSAKSLVALVQDVSDKLNPYLSEGLQAFHMSHMEDRWKYEGILNAPLEWTRDKVLWTGRYGLHVATASATILTPIPYATTREVDTATQAGEPIQFTRKWGNLPTYPRVSVHAEFGAQTTYSLAGCTVQGPMTKDDEMIWDFDNMDFFIIRNGARIANVAHRFTEFNRPSVAVGKSISWTPTLRGPGTIETTRVLIYSRRY